MVDTYVFSIPIFRADLISEARESEIMSEMEFLAAASGTYFCADTSFRDGNVFHIGCAVDGEDFYAAYALACETVAQALETAGERGGGDEERQGKLREWNHLRQDRWLLAQEYFDLDSGRTPRIRRKMFPANEKMAALWISLTK